MSLLDSQLKLKAQSLLKRGKNPTGEILAFSYDLKPRATARKPPKSSKLKTFKNPT